MLRRSLRNHLHVCLLAVCLISAATARAADLRWTPATALPDREGFAAMFAGTSHGRLLVAGGANFPERPPWEGGSKVWYDNVYVLDRPHGTWAAAGRLPGPRAYGVSVTFREAVLCWGGSDAEQHYADGFRLEWQTSGLQISPLPALPIPIANACGAVVDDRLYVAGGLQSPAAATALHRIFMLDLSSTAELSQRATWTELPAWPGRGRMLSVAAAWDGAFWLIGGAALRRGRDGTVERDYLRDVYRYTPADGWQQLADLPQPVVAAPSPAPVLAQGPLILGGDDGAQVSAAPNLHRGFSTTVLEWHAATRTWTSRATLPAPRVTAPLVPWGRGFALISGEVRPGIRSPEVWILEAAD